MQSKTPCFVCGESIELGSTLGFKESCPKCSADLHCCKNCGFYDTNAYNNCKEPQAERVVDKDRFNFCEYFRLGSASNKSSSGLGDSKQKAKSSLDDLFK